MATRRGVASFVTLFLVTLSHAEPENCAFMCPMVYAPVCASNGATYSNTCMMNSAACRTGSTLSVVKSGPCGGTGIWLDKLAVSKRQCPQACADIYKPVCGSDGKTYANECELKVAACNSGAALKVASSGECPDGTATDAPQTPSDCNVMCTMHYDPVCASDGQTYGNECTMNAAACQMGKVLEIVSHGECPDEVNAAPVNEKQCLGICPMIYLPVCGTDDRTYGNECEMKHEACTSGKDIKVASQGTCEERKANKCEMACFALYAPVCASDGQTYSNECVMQVAACQKGVALKVVSRGECPVISDVCKTIPCPKHYSPVCGSDKKIYGNDCMLANAQCEHKLRGEKLDELPLVSCLLGGN